jgi:hypothetical protein
MLQLELQNKIKSIELSYLFAKNLKHGINENDCWQLFEPSKFIYSFFAYNMIYEIDWKSTFSKNYIWDQRGVKTHTKIYYFLEFLYNSNDIKDFYLTFKKFGSVNNLINNVKFIKPDPNISRTNNCSKLHFKESFLNNYRFAIKELANDNLRQINHYHLLAFTYQIRNNIFHGYKTVGIMTLREQRERLIDYTNIILTTLEQFFDMLSTNYGYFRAHKGELSENINIDN